MLLDVYAEVFVWIGNGATHEEKKKSLEAAQEFVKTDPSGRNLDDTTITVLKQGFEIPSFRQHFIAWDPELWSKGLSYEEIKALALKDGQGALDVASALKNFTDKTYDLKTLQKSAPEGVDPTKKEMYLTDDEFKKVFEMDKPAFASLPAWKQNNLKKKAKLY